mmetsp:Transcript_5981/g.14237  ORF Transcript_5981/g.14237 Transcript_5981/m.14237 type:complete len:204 (-) Transcript_5981:1075-1686(-)
MAVGQLSSTCQLLRGGALLAKKNVLTRARGKEHWLLRDHGHVATEELAREAPHIVAVQAHRTLLHVVEPQQQRDARGLATARWAHECQDLPRPRCEGHAAQDLGFGPRSVREAHSLKLHKASAVLARVGRALHHPRLPLDEAEDLRAGAERAAELREHAAKHHDGHGEAQRVEDERDKLIGMKVAIAHECRANPENHRERHEE